VLDTIGILECDGIQASGISYDDLRNERRFDIMKGKFKFFGIASIVVVIAMGF